MFSRSYLLLVFFAALALSAGLYDAAYGKPPKTIAQCNADLNACTTPCKKITNTNPQMGPTKQGCENRCIETWKQCKIAASKAPKAPPTKVQPKVQPGGAEQPGTESPNVQPEGGIQRY